MSKGDVYLDNVLCGWIVNTASKEFWRMLDQYPFDDLVQDGYLAYAKCWHHYREIFDVPNPTKEQRKWFMALVQRAYYNHITTLANKFSRGVKETAMSQIETESESSTWDSMLPPVLPDAALICALVQLPAELNDALTKLVRDGVDSGAYLRKRIKGARNRRTVRETTEEYWTRVLGQPGVPQKLADYIRP